MMDPTFAWRKRKLLRAVERGMLDTVARMLEGGNDPNESLVRCGRSADAADSLLSRAVESGDVEMVSLLVQAGAQSISSHCTKAVQRAHAGYKNLLYIAFYKLGNDRGIQIANALLDSPDAMELLMDYLSFCLERHDCIKRPCHLSMLQFVLHQGHNPNIHFRDLDNIVRTPLTFAIMREDVDMVRLLCQNGASVNWSMYSQRVYTPLMVCIYKTVEGTRRDLTRYLLDQGACTNVQTDKGNTALHMAVHRRCGFDILMLLLTHGADVTLKDHKGRAAYHTALRQVYYPAFRFLIEAGVSRSVHLTADYATSISNPLANWLYHFNSHPRTLRDICAMHIRSVIGEMLCHKVETLPVPPAIRDYINYSNLEYLRPLFATGQDSLELSLSLWNI